MGPDEALEPVLLPSRIVVAAGGREIGRVALADPGDMYPVPAPRPSFPPSPPPTPLPGMVHEATLPLDGQFLYTTLRKANKVVVIRTADDKVAATIPQPSYPDLVVMEPTGQYAFVTNRHADVVTVIDVKTHRQVKSIPVGKAPHGMALRPHP